MRPRPGPSLGWPGRPYLEATILLLFLAYFMRPPARGQTPLAAGRLTGRASSLRADGGLQLGDGRIVRLAGIELGGGGSDSHAQAARAWIERSVLGRIVGLMPTIEGEDRHGRLLAYVSVDCA